MKEKFELTPEQQDQLGKEKTIIRDQELLSKTREEMVKGLEAMGKSGYVYIDRTRPFSTVTGEINGVKFEADKVGNGRVMIDGIWQNLGQNSDMARELYYKYVAFAIDNKHEEMGVKISNMTIERFDRDIKTSTMQEKKKEREAETVETVMRELM